MISLGKVVATKPVEFQQVKAKVSSGFAMSEQKVSLTKLEVVFETRGSGEGYFAVGSFVYVRADSYVKPWAKTVYSVGDTQFILVPVEELLLLEP